MDQTSFTGEDNSREAEQLRRSVPRVPRDFASSLEQELLGREPTRPTRPLLAAAGATAALAGVVVLFGLAGAGPLGEEQGVNATDDCKIVKTTTRERIPRLVDEAGKPPRIVYRSKLVEHNRRICR